MLLAFTVGCSVLGLGLNAIAEGRARGYWLALRRRKRIERARADARQAEEHRAHVAQQVAYARLRLPQLRVEMAELERKMHYTRSRFLGDGEQERAAVQRCAVEIAEAETLLAYHGAEVSS